MEIGKKYDLEERTYLFAGDVRIFLKTLKSTIANIEDSKQVVRSSGSVGANYIEANEGFSDKDFLYRIKISRKEAKETIYWLKLIERTNDFYNDDEIKRLIKEGGEILKILSSIINKFKNKIANSK